MFTWFRKKRPIAQVTGRGDRLGIYLVPGVFRVTEISYNTDGEAYIKLLKEDRFDRKYRVQEGGQ